MNEQGEHTATIEEVKANAEQAGLDLWHKEGEYLILCYPDMIGDDTVWNFGDSPYECADALEFMWDRWPEKFIVPGETVQLEIA